ncbi:MFS transporter [Sphingomonas sp.]
MATAPVPRRPASFVAFYALASAGGVVAYLPLLSLLLPMRMAEIAGEARMGYFTLAAVLGALVAGAANILFGWASDRSVARGRTRRGWLLAGVIALFPAYAAVALAATPGALLVSVLSVQLAANMVLAPLLAIMADEMPDGQKGVASGLLTLGAPLASAFAALLVGMPMLAPAARLACIPVAVGLCILPLLATRGALLPAMPMAAPQRALARRDLAIAWIARLLVQAAGSVMLLYLLFYFQSIATGDAPADLSAAVGSLMAFGSVLALPAAVALGRLSDRTRRRRAILCGAATVAAAGLGAMALARGWWMGAAGYVVYAAGSGVFLALHSGFSMLLLPSQRHRGRDLGLINLTNTAPALIGPALTWALATARDFTAALAVLALFTVAGGVAMLAVRSRD